MLIERKKKTPRTAAPGGSQNSTVNSTNLHLTLIGAEFKSMGKHRELCSAPPTGTLDQVGDIFLGVKP